MLEVDLNALDTALAAGEPLIDVREADEFAQVRVPGASLIPLSEFVARVGEIPDAETVYIICAVGGRSLKPLNISRPAASMPFRWPVERWRGTSRVVRSRPGNRA